MSRHIFIFLLLFIFSLSYGQTFNLDRKLKITIPKYPDWTVSTQFCDTVKKICQFIQLRKNIDPKSRRFSDITLKFEIDNEKIFTDQDKNGCLLGRYTKIDTVKVSNYTAKRWFGVECNVTKENDPQDKLITIYSIDFIVRLGDGKYLRIISSYFSPDKKESNQLETNLLSLIKDIKISGL